MTTRLTSSLLPKFLSNVDTFLFDCDGVLWKGGVGINGVGAVISSLQALGKRCYFVTNNSTKSRSTYVEMLDRVSGIKTTKDFMLTSAYAAGVYLRESGITKKVYVVGDSGLCAELREVAGVECLGFEDAGKSFSFGKVTKDELDKEVEAVVVGFDPNFCYYKLMRAVSYLRYSSPGIPFVATNQDLTYPDANQLVPGNGSLVAAVEAGAGRPPTVVAGKPSQSLVSLVTAATSLDPSRTCMVGDRLDTDIAFGNKGGFKTLLVLTGVATEDSLATASAEETPTFLVDSLGDLEHWFSVKN